MSEVARRDGLRPQQLFGWRHYARNGQFGGNGGDPPAFVPMITDGATAPASAPSQAGIVEIDVAGTVIRAGPGVDWRHLRDVLRAVKAAI